MEDLEDAKAEKEQLMQKCHDLEMQVNLLQDEKSNINAEYELLQKEVWKPSEENYHPVPWLDSISRPISSQAKTRPRHQGF
jgi:predicted nuclease with TOPRIM domain